MAKKNKGYGGARSFEGFIEQNGEYLFSIGFPGVVFDRHEDFGYFLEHGEHPDAVWTAEDVETDKLGKIAAWALKFKRHDPLAGAFYRRVLGVLQERGVAFTHRSEAELEADFLGSVRSKTLPFVIDDEVIHLGQEGQVVYFEVTGGMVRYLVKIGEREFNVSPDSLKLKNWTKD